MNKLVQAITKMFICYNLEENMMQSDSEENDF